LHPIGKANPHIALQVDNLLDELAGKQVSPGPDEPIPGYNVANINDNGRPIELIETDLWREVLCATTNQQNNRQTDGLHKGLKA